MIPGFKVEEADSGRMSFKASHLYQKRNLITNERGRTDTSVLNVDSIYSGGNSV